MAARAKRQAQIPGTESKHIKEVDSAAEEYVVARDKRMELTKEEKATKVKLLEVMKKHSLTVYRDDEAEEPLIVELIAGEDDVKVKRAKVEDPEE